MQLTLHLDMPVVGFKNFFGNGKPQSSSRDTLSFFAFHPVKLIEDLFYVLFGDSDPVS